MLATLLRDFIDSLPTLRHKMVTHSFAGGVAADTPTTSPAGMTPATSTITEEEDIPRES